MTQPYLVCSCFAVCTKQDWSVSFSTSWAYPTRPLFSSMPWYSSTWEMFFKKSGHFSILYCSFSPLIKMIKDVLFMCLIISNFSTGKYIMIQRKHAYRGNYIEIKLSPGVSYLSPELVQASVSRLFDGPQHLWLPLLQSLKQTLKVLISSTLCQLAIFL